MSALLSAARADARRIAAFTRRDARINLSYHFDLVMRAFGIGASLFMFFFLGELVGGSPLLGEYQGGYFEFVLVGAIVMNLSVTCLRSFTGAVQSAQGDQTLEILLSTSTRLGVLMAGAFVFPMLFALVDAAAFLGVGALISPIGLRWTGVLLSVPVLLLLLGTFGALGLASAAFVILTKRGDPISSMAAQASALLAGAVFPVDVLPGILQSLARLVPAFYGMRAMRDLMLGGAGFASVLPDVAVLLGFNVLLIPLALAFLRWSVRTAKVTGTLGNR